MEGGAGSEEHLGLHHVVHEVGLQLDCDVLKEHLIQNLFKPPRGQGAPDKSI